MPKEIDGKPIIDAKRAVVIHITDSDVDNADPKKPENCAAAACIKRELHAHEVRVHLSRVYILANKGNWQRYVTPDNLRNEIIAFDRGGKFAPGEYKLVPFQPAHRLGKKRKSGKSKTHPQRGNRATPHVVKDVRNGPA